MYEINKIIEYYFLFTFSSTLYIYRMIKESNYGYQVKVIYRGLISSFFRISLHLKIDAGLDLKFKEI